MPSTLIHGAEIVYEDVGAGERPLVLVHGLTGFRDDFRERLPALAELGRTIIYDHRGHGDSANTGDAATYTFDQLVADLGALLDARGVGACDLLGHSMGGMVALRFALAQPRRVASLILMDTAARAPDRMPRAPFAAAGAIDGTRPGPPRTGTPGSRKNCASQSASTPTSQHAATPAATTCDGCAPGRPARNPATPDPCRSTSPPCSRRRQHADLRIAANSVPHSERRARNGAP